MIAVFAPAAAPLTFLRASTVLETTNASTFEALIDAVPALPDVPNSQPIDGPQSPGADPNAVPDSATALTLIASLDKTSGPIFSANTAVAAVPADYPPSRAPDDEAPIPTGAQRLPAEAIRKTSRGPAPNVGKPSVSDRDADQDAAFGKSPDACPPTTLANTVWPLPILTATPTVFQGTYSRANGPTDASGRVTANPVLARPASASAEDNPAIAVTVEQALVRTPDGLTAVQPAPTAVQQQISPPEPNFAHGSIDRHLDLSRGDRWLSDLARDITSLGDDRGHLKFVLAPETLGTLDVDVRRGSTGLTLQMTTRTEAARDALVSAQPRLLDEIRAQGVRIASAEIASGSADAGARDQNAHPWRSVSSAPIEIANRTTDDGKPSLTQRSAAGRYA